MAAFKALKAQYRELENEKIKLRKTQEELVKTYLLEEFVQHYVWTQHRIDGGRKYLLRVSVFSQDKSFLDFKNFLDFLNENALPCVYNVGHDGILRFATTPLCASLTFEKMDDMCRTVAMYKIESTLGEDIFTD